MVNWISPVYPSISKPCWASGMDLLYGIQTEQTPGPSVQIDCGKCGNSGTVGRAYDQVETFKLLHLIPVLRLRNTFVTCESCGAQLRSRLTCLELLNRQGDDLREFISYEVSFVVKFMAVISILLCVIPVLGLVLSLITVCLTVRSRGWPWILGTIALVVSSVTTVVSLVGIFMGLL